MGNVLLTGASGPIGAKLLDVFPKAVVLSRRSRDRGTPAFTWQPTDELPPRQALAGATHVVHLAGEPVASGRWSESRKQRIRDSRVTGTRNLVAGLATLEDRPRVLVCASAVGYYGSRGDEQLDEQSPRGEGFLADVCSAWENEALQARAIGIRVVCLRIGLVLSREGGALERMLPVFRMGAGGRLGDGQQWMPWIHIDDVVGLIEHALANDSVEGPVNAVAPHPVRNRKFTEALAKAVNRPAVIPVPEIVLRLAFGELSSVLVASQYVLPRQAENTGYRFRFSDIESALRDVVNVRSGKVSA